MVISSAEGYSICCLVCLLVFIARQLNAAGSPLSVVPWFSQATFFATLEIRATFFAAYRPDNLMPRSPWSEATFFATSCFARLSQFLFGLHSLPPYTDSSFKI